LIAISTDYTAAFGRRHALGWPQCDACIGAQRHQRLGAQVLMVTVIIITLFGA
jgi:hypothetical protein